MSTCPFVSVADAIVAELDAARVAETFGVNEFQSEVIWGKRTIALEERNALRVDVCPMSWSQSLKSRGSWSWLCHYQIGIRKRFEPDEKLGQTGEIVDSALIELVNLTADVLKYFMPVRPDHQGRRLADVPAAVWREEKDGKTLAIVDWDDLSELSQFTGHFELTYEVAQSSA